MDFAISNWIYNTFGTSKAFAIFWAIVSFLGNTWAVVVASALMLCFKKTRKLAVYIAITCFMVFVMNSIIIKNLIERPRPFVTHPEFAIICENAGMELLYVVDYEDDDINNYLNELMYRMVDIESYSKNRK